MREPAGVSISPGRSRPPGNDRGSSRWSSLHDMSGPTWGREGQERQRGRREGGRREGGRRGLSCVSPAGLLMTLEALPSPPYPRHPLFRPDRRPQAAPAAAADTKRMVLCLFRTPWPGSENKAGRLRFKKKKGGGAICLSWDESVPSVMHAWRSKPRNMSPSRGRSPR